jgi:hypothetical protein
MRCRAPTAHAAAVQALSGDPGRHELRPVAANAAPERACPRSAATAQPQAPAVDEERGRGREPARHTQGAAEAAPPEQGQERRRRRWAQV